MRPLLLAALATGAAALAFPAAAERVPLDPSTQRERPALAPSRVRIAAPESAKIQSSGAAASPNGAASTKVAGSHTLPGTPMANAFRAYPPSCAADPLPDKPSGPTWKRDVKLYATNTAGQPFTETVTVTVWRLACSSSGYPQYYSPGGEYNAMTLMRIDRRAQYEGDASVWPAFPLVEVSQGGVGFGSAASLVRVAAEPNTVISEVDFDSPVIDSTTYVLENYPYDGAGYFIFSDAFRLRIDPLLDNVQPVTLDIPAYNPTPSTYPTADGPMELDGYLAAQWLNTEYDEGLIVQVAEQYDSAGNLKRQVIFDLLTEDNDGYPLWLVGNKEFPVGATSITIDTIWLDRNKAQRSWGKVTLEMWNCMELDVAFQPRSGLPAKIPAISGTTTYQRVFVANGLSCE